MGAWKMALVPDHAAAPICMCGFSRDQHEQIVMPPGSDGDQTAIIYLKCIFESSGCKGYSPDQIQGSLGNFGN